MPAPPAPDDRIVTAVTLRLVAAACMATMSACIKLAEAEGAGLVDILFVRQALGVPLVAGVIAIGPGLAVIAVPPDAVVDVDRMAREAARTSGAGHAG